MLTNKAQEVEALMLSMVKERDANKRAAIAFQMRGRIKTLDSAAALFLDYKEIADRQAEVIDAVKAMGLTIAIDDAPIGAERLKEDE